MDDAAADQVTTSGTPSQQNVSQDDGIVVEFVVSRVHERDQAFPAEILPAGDHSGLTSAAGPTRAPDTQGVDR
jgi:hypothetical protein